MSDTGWTIHIETRGHPGITPSDIAIDAFQVALEERAGAISVGPGSYGTTFSLLPADGIDPKDAARCGIDVFLGTSSRSGMPDFPIVLVELETFAEQDADLARPAFPELVGVAEIAKALGVSKQRAHQLTGRDDFPAPVADLKAGRIWTRTSLGHFVEQWRAGKPEPGPDLDHLDALLDQLTRLRSELVQAPTSDRAAELRAFTSQIVGTTSGTLTPFQDWMERNGKAMPAGPLVPTR